MNRLELLRVLLLRGLLKAVLRLRMALLCEMICAGVSEVSILADARIFLFSLFERATNGLAGFAARSLLDLVENFGAFRRYSLAERRSVKL